MGERTLVAHNTDFKNNVPVACFLAVVREDPLIGNSQKIKQ